MNKKTLKILLLSFVVLIVCQAVRAGAIYDFDGDGKTDPTLRTFDRQTGQMYWYILQSREGFSAIQWGGTSDPELFDQSVPEDYDGDGKWDVAVWRSHIREEGQSYFYIYYSSSNTYQAVPWGLRYDWAMPQDYDGDGKADIAVARKDNFGAMTWYILQSRDGFRAEQFGGGSDTPVRGDYDGDCKADLAVYRQDPQIYRGDFTFYIKRSSDNSWIVEKFGYAQADMVAPGDYDGDGKTDIAVWRGRSEYGNGVWYWHRSSDGGYDQTKWGFTDTPDKPVQGDYDGDGKTDPAVWRQATGSCAAPNPSYFYIKGSRDGFTAIQWGNTCFGTARIY